MEKTPDSSEVAALTTAAEELVGKIDELNRDSGRQLVTLTRKSRNNQIVLVTVIIAGLVVAAAVAVMGLSLSRTNANANKIDDLTQRLETAQTTQRQKALCPLYGLFLTSKNDKSRAAYPQGEEAYDNAFKIIQEGHTVLQCSAFIVGEQ